MWRRGDEVLVRAVFRGRVVGATPATVAAGETDAVVTWVAPQTPVAYPQGLDEAGRLLPVATWHIGVRPWFGRGALDLTPHGRAHMIRHFWRADGTFRGWYVNLQDPARPTARGWDTMDHQLDLWVEPGGQVAWKDEDHLEQAVEQGMFTADDAAAIWREGERVLAEWPFPTGWEDFRPDPDWPLPELPEDWHLV